MKVSQQRRNRAADTRGLVVGRNNDRQAQRGLFAGGSGGGRGRLAGLQFQSSPVD